MAYEGTNQAIECIGIIEKQLNNNMNRQQYTLFLN